MDEQTKRFIRDHVANGHLIEILQTCVAECHLQADETYSDDDQLAGVSQEWSREEKILDKAIEDIEKDS